MALKVFNGTLILKSGLLILLKLHLFCSSGNNHIYRDEVSISLLMEVREPHTPAMTRFDKSLTFSRQKTQSV